MIALLPRSLLMHFARGLLLIGASLGTCAQAGVLIETIERTNTGGERPSSVMRAQGGKARIESGAQRGGVVIFKDDTMYILDPQRKTYMVIDQATLERTMGAMSGMMEQMRAQMANLPPEQRAAMENMMKQNGISMDPAAKAPTYDVVATGATDKAAGLTCKVMNVKRDGSLWQQLCVVPNGSVPGYSEFAALAQSMRKMIEKAGSMAQQFMGGPLQHDEALAAKLNGIPVITRRFRDGIPEKNEVVVKSWQTTNVGAEQFEIPTGYTKQEMPSLPAR